ncbi:MAG: nicotinamide riboside transporter PnuC [Streptosporangiales bacterium]|nr:nicotinamide riboside transporter PnuC [Streptosporangiales bacterium]
MNVLAWVNSVAFTVGSEEIRWTDLVGSVGAIAVVGLAAKRSLATWPVQLASCALLFAASVGAHLGGNAARQVAIAVIAGYGWWRWARGRRENKQVEVRWASWRARLGMLAVLAAGTAAVAWLLAETGASWSPLPDAYIFVGSLVAFYGQARGWVEFWFVWILVDLVGVPLAYSHGLVVYATTYVVFFVLCVVGIVSWVRQSGRQTPAPGELEEVPA